MVGGDKRRQKLCSVGAEPWVARANGIAWRSHPIGKTLLGAVDGYQKHLLATCESQASGAERQIKIKLKPVDKRQRFRCLGSVHFPLYLHGRRLNIEGLNSIE